MKTSDLIVKMTEEDFNTILGIFSQNYLEKSSFPEKEENLQEESKGPKEGKLATPEIPLTTIEEEQLPEKIAHKSKTLFHLEIPMINLEMIDTHNK